MQYSIGNKMPTYSVRPFHVIQPQSKHQKYNYSWATEQLGLRSYNFESHYQWTRMLIAGAIVASCWWTTINPPMDRFHVGQSFPNQGKKIAWDCFPVSLSQRVEWCQVWVQYELCPVKYKLRSYLANEIRTFCVSCVFLCQELSSSSSTPWLSCPVAWRSTRTHMTLEGCEFTQLIISCKEVV